ncbi:hypothetical protein [Peredibacter starrii]|uniref:Metalloprotease n=1 Tax=Peredibacter starrii TaxID=28202 RepID=A0AAX4HT80_9BACT|nr:hypothetical protein [Peredibacter starrii]WPU66417.1 hypothetical protein SOO65_06630 [Peredibacter starrii]
MFKLLALFFLCFAFSAQAQVTLAEFQIIKAVFEAEFGPELKAQNARLNINRPPTPATPNFWWDLEAAHASYSGYKDPQTGIQDHNLYLFGGYGKMVGMTMDGVAMTLCHELGHGIGGAPYKNKTDNIQASTEGQSDYYAARYCIKRIFKRLPEEVPVKAPDTYTAKLCEAKFKKSEDLKLCYRGFQELEVERIFLRTQGPNDTYYDTPDKTVVKKTDLSPTFYPSPQCRLDTMMAGLLEKERPRCWFAP